MSTTTSIEWTDRTWNPTTGCDKVSSGCAHCYAEVIADRFWASQYPRIPLAPSEQPVIETAYGNFTVPTRPRQFTDVMTHDDRLLEPLSWRKPSKVFVNSMSDLFHEDVPDAFIDKVFAVMALASRHTFQILTKRPDRMLAYFSVDRYELMERVETELWDMHNVDTTNALGPWPLKNVWLGVSVENQHFADERIPLLLQTPAAVRFISAEPLLGLVDLSPWLVANGELGTCTFDDGPDSGWLHHPGSCPKCHDSLDWVIVGGESGSGARPFDLAWARSIVQQCKAAGVPVFVKQVGAKPIMEFAPQCDQLLTLKDRKGGDPSEWPDDLRVREFPEMGVGGR